MYGRNWMERKEPRATNTMKNDTCKTGTCREYDSHGKWIQLDANGETGKHKVKPRWSVQLLAILQPINIWAVKLQIVTIKLDCRQQLNLSWSRVHINLTSLHISASPPLLSCHWESSDVSIPSIYDCLVNLFRLGIFENQFKHQSNNYFLLEFSQIFPLWGLFSYVTWTACLSLLQL